ncbi:MAG: OmpH family outer membrane protein [Thermoanaerobaculia bacterium]|nr:OmpH family outer membrane protein [Thermoanaerobaculia bacterium]
MKKAILSVFAILVAAPVFAQSAPSRIAVIDVQRVLAVSEAGKSAYETLQTKQKQHVDRLKTMEDEIKRLEADFQQKRLSMSEDKIQEMQQQISDKRITLQRSAQDAERELTAQRDRTLQALEKEIMPVINEIGKEMGFAVIFNKLEAGLIFASDAVDITDVVVKRVNERVSPKAASN